MSRSKWKNPFADLKTTETFTGVNKSILVARGLKIAPLHLGGTFKIHNGKGVVELSVNGNMVGHKFGEFVFTRARNTYKRKKNAKKARKIFKKKLKKKK